MRTAIVLAIALAFTGCGKKKPAQSPANAAPAAEAAPASDDMKSKDAPAEGEDSKSTHSSDPCEGGE